MIAEARTPLIAKSPGRYAQIFEIGEEDNENLVTGYKIEVDLIRREYTSFIQKGDDVWIVHSVNRPIANMLSFWSEIAYGQLIPVV